MYVGKKPSQGSVRLSTGLTQPDSCSRTHQGCTQAILRLRGETLQEDLQFHVITGAQDVSRDF